MQRKSHVYLASAAFTLCFICDVCPPPCPGAPSRPGATRSWPGEQVLTGAACGAQVQTLRPPALQAVLLDLPGLLFFSTYTLLVLFWAEIYHQARSLSTRALRPAFLAFNAVVYAAEVALWLVAGLVHGDNVAGLVRVISCAFLAAVSLAAAAGFLIYGGRLFLMLRRCVPADMQAAWRLLGGGA